MRTRKLIELTANCSFTFTKHEAMLNPENFLQLKPLGRGVQTLEMHQRRLYSGTSATAANAGNSEAKMDAEAKQAGEGKSEGSDQGSDAGKPVRGGVTLHSLS